MKRPSLLLILGGICVPAIAVAHIHLTYPTVRTSEQKIRHCGLTNAPRANVSTFAPGATITVTWQETIQHTGWFRIAFQADGDDFQIPPSENGTGPGGGGFPETDYTGMTDPATGSLIIRDRIADGTLSFDITLPSIECTNCTLQLTQFMTSGHGDYGEHLGEADDIYFQCADLILSATAADAAPPTADAAGSADAAPGSDAGNPVDGGGGGCCSVGGGPSGILTVLAMVGLIRRRRGRAA